MRPPLGVLALVLMALAWAALMQPPGSNQNAHLALVKSLADGTPQIDRYRNETGDTAYIDGHYYAAKAPGLALVTVPWYLALDAAGLVVSNPAAGKPWPEAMLGTPRSAGWEVALFGATVPAFVLLLLVRAVADRLVPGYGTIAAVTVGAGSLLGVLATFFFAHALSSCLGFAAFALLVRERNARPNTRLVFAAGLLAGFAVVVEFPLVILAAAVGLYAAADGASRPRRAAAYTGGFAVGVLPVIAFNTWAFGSPATLSYTNAVVQPGTSGHDVVGANVSGLFGVGVPSLRAGLELLLSSKGLLVLTPIWALAVVGLVELWRRGRRAEAAVVSALAGAFLIYNAAYYLPFGGFFAGPRFLLPVLPFLALPIAAAWRAFPGISLVLALASIVVTSVAAVSEPLQSSESAGTWFHRLEHGHVTHTVLRWAWGGGGTAGALLVLVLVGVAVLIALHEAPLARIDARGVLVACAALATWRIVYVSTPVMLTVDRAERGWQGAAAVVVLGLAVAYALLLLAAARYAAFLPALLLTPLAVPRFAAHTSVSLATVSVALVGLLVLARWREPQCPKGTKATAGRHARASGSRRRCAPAAPPRRW